MNDLPQTSVPETAPDLPHLSGNGEGMTSTPAPSEAAPAARHGQFRILRPHARGGLGQVSLAMDESLGRTVAVKEIRADVAQNAHTRRRFVQEAEVTGQLEHPNIIPIYALGQDEHGRPYYAMRFVDGQTLEQLIATYHAAPTPLAFQDLLRRFVAVCQAMAYAHSQGIIHRDLKPANIMTGRYGETLILDWGLAKRLNGKSAQKPEHEPSEHALELPALSGGGETLAGHAIGTPAYMPPEQAHSATESPSASADIYALGAILYQTLTGRPPHQGESRTEVISRAAIGEVARPSSIRRQVPKALEAVCLKAMARKPEDRYASAVALAQEAERFLADEPVAAYQQPILTRATRWGRRHKPAVAAAAALLITAVFALAISNVLIARQRNAKVVALQAERQAREDANQNLQLARSNERLARGNESLARQNLLHGMIEAGDSKLASARPASARHNYLEAWKLAEELGLSELPATTGLLASYTAAEPPLRESRVARGPAKISGSTAKVRQSRSMTMLPGGRTVLVSGVDATPSLWDPVRGTEVRRLVGPTTVTRAVTASPDGKLALTGGKHGRLDLWDIPAGKHIGMLPEEGTSPSSRDEEAIALTASFSPDGRTAASGHSKTIHLWDIEHRRHIRVLDGHTSFIGTIAFSPDGKTLLSGSQDETLRLWDLSNGQEIRRFTAPGGIGALFHVAFAPDGQTALSGGIFNVIQLWDVATGREIRRLEGHTGTITFVAFTPDGRYAVSTSTDRTVRVWDLSTGRQVCSFSGHAGAISGGAVAPDGRTAVSMGADGSVMVWRLPVKDEILPFHPGERIAGAAFSPDGMMAASASFDGRCWLWDLSTGRSLRNFRVKGGAPWCIAFSPDGRAVAYGGENKRVIVSDVASGRELVRCEGHTDLVTGVAFSPDGRTIASSSSDHTIRLWDAATGAEARCLTGHSHKVRGVKFSPGGQVLLSTSFDRTVRLWDVASGRELRHFHGHRDWVHTASFTPDGKQVLSAGWDGSVRIWDAQSTSEVGQLPDITGITLCTAVSPDGRLALTCGQDTAVRLWDLTAFRELRRFSQHADWVTSVAFSPDGQSIISGSRDGTLRLLNLRQPLQYQKFERRLAGVADALASNSDDPAAMLTLGEWYAFRGADEWAVEFLEQARAVGASVSPLMLARCYWKLDRRDDAQREFQLALERGEAPAEYLNLCISAVTAGNQ